MHRRRLVNATDDRLEIANVERPRVEVAVPSDDVEWMVVEYQLVDSIVLLYEKTKVAHLVVRVERHRTPDVALRVRRTFLQLPKLVPISLWRANVSVTLHHEQLRLPLRVVEPVTMQNSAVNDEVVTFTKRQISVHRLQHAAAFRDVHELVRLRVAIEVLITHAWLDVQHGDVVVEQHWNAIERRATAGLRSRGEKMPMPQRLVWICLELRFRHTTN